MLPMCIFNVFYSILNVLVRLRLNVKNLLSLSYSNRDPNSIP